MSTIKKIYISCDGFPSVGIPGNSVTICAGGEFIFESDLGDDILTKNYLNYYRDQIGSVFEKMWDDRVTVLYDFEYDALLNSDSQ